MKFFLIKQQFNYQYRIRQIEILVFLYFLNFIFLHDSFIIHNTKIMACFSGLFSKKKKKYPDTELHVFNQILDPENEITKPRAYSLSAYMPSKELFPSSPPNDCAILEIPPESPDDLSFLADAKTFTDYFITASDIWLPCSALVSEQEKNFERLLKIESESNWDLKMSKPFAKIYTKTVNF